MEHQDLNVCIVGQGYVGLPLSLAVSQSGLKVIALDRSAEHLQNIEIGKHDLLNSQDKVLLARQIREGWLKFSLNPEDCRKSSIFVICVPTPLTSEGNPDLSFIKSAVESIIDFLNPDALVILESTSYPGTTRQMIHDLITNVKPELKGIDIAFSPERIDPLNPKWTLKTTPKVVSGINERSKLRAIQFYRRFVDQVVSASSLEIAEFTKLMENSFRLINISFVNEMMMIASKLKINIWEALDLAETKPFGFMKFNPGSGIGGHCIPVDPAYLQYIARKAMAFSLMIESALSVNKSVPKFIVSRIEELLPFPAHRKVLLSGVAYKWGVSDTRESTAIDIAQMLRGKGYGIEWHDPFVKEFPFSNLSGGTFDLLLILKGVDESILDLAISSKIVVLDCTGLYRRTGVTAL